MAFAGLMGGDHRALVMISHQGIDRREVLECAGPTMALGCGESCPPCRSGLSATVVAPAPEIEPMPVSI